MFLFFITLLSCGNDTRSRNASKSINLKIGISLSSNVQSDSIVKGAQLALKELDGSMPKGKILTLEVKDDRGDINRGIINASSFADDKDIIAVVGHRESFVSLACSSIYEHKGIVMISPFARAGKLTQNGYKYVFRSIPRNEEISEGIVSFLKSKGVNNLTICYKNGVFGYDYTNALERVAESNGINLVDRISYSVGDKREFNRILNRFEHFNHNAVVFFGDIDTGLNFYTVADEKDIKQLLLSNHEMATDKFLGLGDRVTRNRFFHMPFNINDNRYHVRSFIRKYRQEYGEDPDYDAAVGYDSIKLLVAAISENRSYSPKDIANALRKLRGHKGILFTNYSFDDEGNLIVNDEEKRVSIQESVDNEFKFLGEF